MQGVLINTVAVLLGSSLGLLLRRGVPEKILQAVMTALGLSTLYLGISGALVGQDAIAIILALALGAALGTALNIDGAINRLGERIQQRFKHPDSQGRIGEGFVTASLLFCVGSMAIVGSLNAGLSGDQSMLLAKSVLDMISSFMLAASLGFGVMLAALPVLIYQGAIVLLAGLLKPLLSEMAIAQMSCAGSLLILALGLNFLQVSRIKVADLLPAIFLAPIITLLTQLI